MGDLKYLHQLTASIDQIFVNFRAKLPKLQRFLQFLGIFFWHILDRILSNLRSRGAYLRKLDRYFAFKKYFTVPQESIVFSLGDINYFHQLTASIDRIFANFMSKLPKS